MTEDDLKRIYDDTANDPGSWLYAADNCLIAADALDAARETAGKRGGPIEHAMRTGTQSIMLRAFAVEGLIKAVYVHIGGTLGEDGILKKDFPKNHNLAAMWEKAKLPTLTPDRRSLLADLTFVCTSLGRYPIATSYDKRRPVLNSLLNWNGGKDQELAVLIAELKSRLPPSHQPYP